LTPAASHLSQGPRIGNPLRTRADLDALVPMADVGTRCPFLGKLNGSFLIH
jgi:hypothetical protein